MTTILTLRLRVSIDIKFPNNSVTNPLTSTIYTLIAQDYENYEKILYKCMWKQAKVFLFVRFYTTKVKLQKLIDTIFKAEQAQNFPHFYD